MIKESKWKNFRVFTDAFIHWLQCNSNIFEKIPIIDVLKGKVVNPEEGMQSGKTVSYFGFISNNVIMKNFLVLCNHIVQYTSYRSQKYKLPSPYYDNKYPR